MQDIVKLLLFAVSVVLTKLQFLCGCVCVCVCVCDPDTPTYLRDNFL